MAFTYRTPAQLFASSLSSEDQSEILKHSIKRFEYIEKSSSYNYSYSLSDVQKEFCISVGVPLSIANFVSHPHPYNKTMENYLLFDNVYHYINQIDNFVSIKEEKFEKLTRGRHSSPTKLINRAIADRDLIRYKNIIRKPSPNQIKQIVDGRKNERWFFHDELHHWSPDDVYGFLKDNQPEMVLASVVCPPEVFDCAESMNPSFYSFEVTKRRLDYVEFIYCPDDSQESSYFQRSYKFWFNTSHIVVGDCTYTISFMRSIKAHHLILIQKGNLKTSERYISDNSECLCSSVFDTSRIKKRGLIPIRWKIFKSEIIYLMSLKKPDSQSAAAKLRQLSDGDYTGGELAFFMNLAKKISNSKKVFDCADLLPAIFDSIISICGDRIRLNLSSIYNDLSVENLIIDSKPYRVEFKRKVRPNVNDSWLDDVDQEGLEEENRLNLTLLDKFSDGSSFLLKDRSSQAYYGTKTLLDRMTSEINEVFINEKVKVIERRIKEFKFADLSRFKEISFEESRFGFRGGFYNIFKKRYSFSSNYDNCLRIKWNEEEPNQISEKEDVEMMDAFIPEHERALKSKPRDEELDSKKEGEETKDGGVGGNRRMENEEETDQMGLMSKTNESDSDSEDFTYGCSISRIGENFKFTYEGAFKKLINEIFMSPGVFRGHKGRETCFVSPIEDLTYGFNNVVYKNCQSETINEMIAKFSEYFNVELNSALVQKYVEGASIGLHRDDEKVYDDTPVVTLNLFGEANFKIERAGLVQTFNLHDGDIVYMKRGEQRTSKHSVESLSEGRVSITMRNQVRYMNGNPIKKGRSDQTEIPEDLSERINSMVNGCFLDALATHLKMSRESVVSFLISMDDKWLQKIINDVQTSTEEMINTLVSLGIPGKIMNNGLIMNIPGEGSYDPIFLKVRDGHVSSENGFEQEGVMKMSFKEAIKKSNVSAVFPKFNTERARRLIKSMQEGATGILLNRFKHAFNEISAKKNDCYTISGFAGSGKSHKIQEIISTYGNRSDVLICSPRKILLDDWQSKIERKLNGKKNLIKLRTFELAIKTLQSRSRKRLETFLIIDEVSLLPGGYLDLCNSLLVEGSVMIMIFDPLQASYFSKKDHTRNLGDVFEPLYGTSFKYLYQTYRFKNFQNFENLVSMSAAALDENHMKFYLQPEAVRAAIRRPIFLCPSEEKREELKRYGDAYTFGTAQGLTFDFVVISLDLDGPITSDAHWMVALTRGRKGFAFLSCPTIKKKDFLDRTEGKLINKVLNGMKISLSYLRGLGGKVMENVTFYDENEKVGRTREEFEDILEYDPWLKAQINFLELNDVEVEVEEPNRKESPPRTHLSIQPEGQAFVDGPSLLKSRESREFRGLGLWSEQFDDLKKGRRLLNNEVERFENIYPRHNASDSLTFWAAIKKRLKFSNALTERRKLESLRGAGENLFEIFKKTYEINNLFKPDMELIEKTFIEKRLNKSKKMIEAHSERSDPDWKVNHFFLFMKSQLCTKYEKRFCEAKAGQTLACFSHRVLMRFGIKIREAEAKLRACLGENIYIHSGKKLEELNEWSKRYCSDCGTDSDYEAFDRSQDALILAFEIPLLRFLGWDESLVAEYIDIKLNLGCRLGYLAIMRFTGEFGTFFLNTCCNMLFTALRYKIDCKTPICFAGDDMFSPGRLSLRHDREFLLERFKLKAKVNFSLNPMFCGWRMTKFGIVKEPKLILERFRIARERGNFRECLINYCLEASFAYRLGDRLYDVIKNIEDFQEVVRLIVKEKDNLPAQVKSEFESYDHEFGGHSQISEKSECRRVHSFGCGLECNI
ncbi:replicase [Trichosanthes tepovirus A]|nr:replicase [Trichosanthes tepovirus A]